MSCACERGYTPRASATSAGPDELIAFAHLGLHPVEQAGPEFLAEEDQREAGDAPGLHQRGHFEELIKRAEAAGHEDEADAVFDEANFAREKIMEIDRDVGETISFLLEWQFNI